MADSPEQGAQSLWDFVRRFDERFLQRIVRPHSPSAEDDASLASSIRGLASDDPHRAASATRHLSHLVKALFDEPTNSFLEQFDASWGVVLLWDDFRQTFINTGGFTNYTSLHRERQTRRYAMVSQLVDRQEVFRSHGFTEPMTDLIFRARVVPEPLVIGWPKPGTEFMPDDATAGPTYLAFDALGQHAPVRAHLNEISEGIEQRLDLPSTGARDDVVWLAGRLRSAAQSILASENSVFSLIERHYQTVVERYKIKGPAPGPEEIRRTLQTMLWNRVFDDDWQYLYFVPTQLPNQRAVSGLLLACRTQLQHPRYTALIEIVNRVLAVFHFGLYGFQKERYARQAAVTAIMARNMSHNIGSHVMPRARTDQIFERLDDLAPAKLSDHDRALVAGSLRDRLDEYVQKKADFLSEITTEPMMSTRPAMLYQDVVLPFLQNSLLIDSLAANEGVRYSKVEGRAPRSRLQLRVRVGRPDSAEMITIAARFRCEDDECPCKSLPVPADDPSTPSYISRCPFSPDRVLVATIDNSEADVHVDLPGPLGEFALYGFLENLVRNGAKHNRERIGDGDLVITMDVRDTGNPEHYEVTIWDNLSTADRIVDQATAEADAAAQESRDEGSRGRDPARLTLRDYLSGQLRRDFIQESGEIQREAWGLKEMVVCAALLGGATDFSSLRHDRPLDVVRIGDDGLGFRFRMMRSRNVTALLDPEAASLLAASRESLARQGVKILTTRTELEAVLSTGGAGRSGRFAVLMVPDYGEEAARREFAEWLKVLLPRLPARVLVYDPANYFLAEANPGLDVRLPLSVRLIDVPFDTTTEHWSSMPALVKWLWPLWLQRWLFETQDNVRLEGGISMPSRTSDIATVDVFFEQQTIEQPTKRWGELANEFNKRSSIVQIAVSGLDGSEVKACNLLRRRGRRHVMFDRHGRMLTTMLGSPSLDAVDLSYMVLGKDSPDFIPMFSAPLPRDETTWLLPWELAEAGLLRILVIDERIAEASYQSMGRRQESRRTGSDDSEAHDYAIEKWTELFVRRGAPDGFTAWRWHAAWLAQVFVCTEFGFETGPTALHDSVYQKKTPHSPVLSIRVADGVTADVRPFGAAGVPGHKPGAGRQRFDVVLIHQGVLDNRCGGRGKDCLKALHLDIPTVVVESGRGVPLTLSREERFLPFSLVHHYLLGGRIGKLGLTRTLMSLARAGRLTGG